MIFGVGAFHVPPGQSLSVEVLTNNPLPDVLILLFVVTFLVTSYRCFSRYSKRLWWHDDSMALFSTLSLIVFLVGSYGICF